MSDTWTTRHHPTAAERAQWAREADLRSEAGRLVAVLIEDAARWDALACEPDFKAAGIYAELQRKSASIVKELLAALEGRDG